MYVSSLPPTLPLLRSAVSRVLWPAGAAAGTARRRLSAAAGSASPLSAVVPPSAPAGRMLSSAQYPYPERVKIVEVGPRDGLQVRLIVAVTADSMCMCVCFLFLSDLPGGGLGVRHRVPALPAATLPQSHPFLARAGF